MEGGLLDWELLHGSDTDSIDSHPSDEKSRSLSEIDGASFGMFRSDHFSVDNLIERSGKTTDPSEKDFVESDDLARVDSGSESPNRRKNLNEVLADLSSGQSDEYRSMDACVGKELGFTDGSGGETESKTVILDESYSDEVKLSNFEVADGKLAGSQLVVEELGETQALDQDFSQGLSDLGDLEVANDKLLENQATVEETGETFARDEDSSKCQSDSGREVLVSGDANKENEIVSDSRVISAGEIGGNEERIVEREASAVNPASRSGDESKRSGIVWWKMPFVLLKYSVFKIGPVWTVSVAAAVMGLALLGRRLYNVKKKAQRFQLKVTIDDKKVSRVMSQAARLNEAFTEVRRVPVIRPALPSPSANPWPVLSLR